MSPTYTDMHSTTMPTKNDRGGIPIRINIYGDMEMSPTYTDMHSKTMPTKNDRGGRPERDNIYK